MTTQLPLRIASSSTRIAHLPKNRSSQCAVRLAYRSALRHNQQIRQYSSPTPPPQEPTKPIDLRSQFNSPNPYIKPVDPTSIPPNPPPPKRSLRPYIFAVVSLIIGLTAGQYVRLVLAPPPLPLPDTPEDKLMVEFLTSRAEKLPLVQSLSEDPKWISWDAYSNFNAAERAQRLTTGPLGGARGVGGFQRVFFNEETGECISVVWFGGALAGWPGVTHGGVIATIMDESLGRCAIYQFPSRTGVTANLELNYLKPTITNEFYVVRAIPEKKESTDKKTWVSGRLETLDGMVCVEAKALFVVPKKFKTRGMAGRF